MSDRIGEKIKSQKILHMWEIQYLTYRQLVPILNKPSYTKSSSSSAQHHQKWKKKNSSVYSETLFFLINLNKVPSAMLKYTDIREYIFSFSFYIQFNFAWTLTLVQLWISISSYFCLLLFLYVPFRCCCRCLYFFFNWNLIFLLTLCLSPFLLFVILVHFRFVKCQQNNKKLLMLFYFVFFFCSLLHTCEQINERIFDVEKEKLLQLNFRVNKRSEQANGRSLLQMSWQMFIIYFCQHLNHLTSASENAVIQYIKTKNEIMNVKQGKNRLEIIYCDIFHCNFKWNWTDDIPIHAPIKMSRININGNKLDAFEFWKFNCEWVCVVCTVIFFIIFCHALDQLDHVREINDGLLANANRKKG